MNRPQLAPRAATPPASQIVLPPQPVCVQSLNHTEDLLERLRGRIALVGNATPRRPFGRFIDAYDTVVRFNNFRLEGFGDLVGTRTDLRCTCAWHDVEHREGLIEICPFTADSYEATNLAAFNAANPQPVLCARTDIHPFLPETPKPSTGLALVQLLNCLGIEADLFAFDGFQTGHYWDAERPFQTTHNRRELDILLRRSNVILIGETYPYEAVYEFCHREHAEYDDNVGVELFRRLNKQVRGKKILEFGAGNGGLSALLETWGNEVTALEVSPHAFEKIRCTRKLCDSALGLLSIHELHDLFVSVEVLQHLTENDIRLVLREAARCCSEVFLAVSMRPSGLLGPHGENLHLTVRPSEWWLAQVGQWFDVRAYPGYGVQQLVIEGTLRRRAGLASDVPSARSIQPGAVDPLGLPAGYRARSEPEYFADVVTETTGITWQPDVYPLAAWLARELGCHRIVDVGCGRAEKLVPLHPEFAIAGIDFGPNLEFCRRQYPQGEWLEADLDQPTPWALRLSDLDDAVLVCADVIEHLRDPRCLLRYLRFCLEFAPALVLSTPERVLTRGVQHAGPPDNPAHTREWAIEELVALLQSQGLTVDYAGLTRSNDREPGRNTILCIVSYRPERTAQRWLQRHPAAPSAFPPFHYRRALREKNGDRGPRRQSPAAQNPMDELVARARAALVQEDSTAARAALEQVASAGVADAQVWSALAILRHQAGELEPAAVAWEKAIAKDPASAEAHAALGEVRAELKQWESAIGAYLRALELAPGTTALRIGLAEVLLGAGRPMDALGWFSQLLAEEKEEVGVFWGMARCCAALDDLASARTACECVLALEPLHVEARRLRRRLRPRPVPAPMAEPGWSFGIITNGKRPEKLRAEIASIRALQIPQYEILVAGEPPEGLDPDIRVVPAVEAARGGRLGEMRNRLVAQARFDHLVIADDDLRFQPDFYAGLLRYGDDWEVLCVRLLNPDGTRFWDWATHGGPQGHQLLDYAVTDPYVYVTGGLCLLKAHVAAEARWDEARGFYQEEDVDFSARLRELDIIPQFNPHSTVIHDDGRYTQRGQVVIRREAPPAEPRSAPPSLPDPVADLDSPAGDGGVVPLVNELLLQ